MPVAFWIKFLALILSGGLQFTAQKHREGSKFKYNSGFFITTNVCPDFGPGPDSDAIRRRLCVFETKPLPRKDNNATGKLFSCNFSCMSHCRVNCYVDSVVFRITFLYSFSLDEETLHASFSLPFACASKYAKLLMRSRTRHFGRWRGSYL